jgi:hypothetical protein
MNWKQSLVNRRAFVNALGAILGIGLLVAFGFVLSGWFRTMGTAKESPSVSPLSQSVTVPKESEKQPPSAPPSQEQADPTAGWRVYEDKNLGFSIRFPNDWYQEENPDFQHPKAIPEVLETKVMFASFPSPFLGPAGSVPSGCRFDVLVASTDKDPKQLLKADQYKQIGPLSSPANESSVVVNGIEGIRRTYLPDKKAVQQTRTIVLLPSSHSLFALHFWKENDDKLNTYCNAVFEAMLKTFTILK